MTALPFAVLRGPHFSETVAASLCCWGPCPRTATFRVHSVFTHRVPAAPAPAPGAHSPCGIAARGQGQPLEKGQVLACCCPLMPWREPWCLVASGWFFQLLYMAWSMGCAGRGPWICSPGDTSHPFWTWQASRRCCFLPVSFPHRQAGPSHKPRGRHWARSWLLTPARGLGPADTLL